jgi:hypothetical protein
VLPLESEEVLMIVGCFRSPLKFPIAERFMFTAYDDRSCRIGRCAMSQEQFVAVHSMRVAAFFGVFLRPTN